MANNRIMLLHGALGASEQFLPLIGLLKDRLDIHTLDFEGHGMSPLKPRPFRFAHFAENVIEYLDEHTIDAIHIFGHSMGGTVAVYLARFFPERVKSVFTLATKFQWTPEIAEKENRFLDADILKAKVPHYVQVLKNRHKVAGWEVLLEKIKDQQTFIGRRPPFDDEDCRQIRQRVRISLGDRDKMASLEENIHIYNLLPRGEFQVFPSTDHPLEKIAPQRLADAILDFLNI